MKVTARIKALVTERVSLAAKIKVLKADQVGIDQTVTEWFVGHAEGEDRSATFRTEPGTSVTATLVEPSSDFLDEEMLRSKIGDAAYKKLTKTVRVFDQAKLEDALAKGEVSEKIVKSCIKKVDGTKYVRYTVSRDKKKVAK